MYLKCIHTISSVSVTFITLARHLQHLIRVWSAFTPSPAYTTCLKCFHTVPMVSDVLGMLSCHLQLLRCIWTALERFHITHSVPDAFAMLACHSQHLIQVWDSFTLSTAPHSIPTFLEVSDTFGTHFYAIPQRLRCLWIVCLSSVTNALKARIITFSHTLCFDSCLVDET
jgi:hypothetical protein